MGLAQYGYPPVYHDTHQPMHSMFGHPRLPHHEIFYPPGYLPQAPIPHRMDTRMYKEYLQQPSHFMHDNKTVSEWLEKQRNPGMSCCDQSYDNSCNIYCIHLLKLFSNFFAENFLGEGRDRFINGEVSKDKHEPQVRLCCWSKELDCYQHSLQNLLTDFRVLNSYIILRIHRN